MASPSDRLSALRGELARRDLQGFLIPRADEHLGEYVPPSAERLAWLTGFTGSAGLAVVLPDSAAVFTDGRYTLQVQAQTDSALWECRHITDDPPPAWIAAQRAPERPYRLRSLADQPGGPCPLSRGRAADGTGRTPIRLTGSGATGPSRPPTRRVPTLWPMPAEAREDKRAEIGKTLADSKQDALVVTDPAVIAWLFNLRGADLRTSPRFALGFRHPACGRHRRAIHGHRQS